ncbi:MAG: ACT domain-containing protein, partial [Deltaproteobacteria bacterium]
EARVHPTMVPRDHLLATVRDAFNAIYVTGDFSGPVLLFGSGAGMDPTASAVVGDIIDIARNLRMGVKRRVPFSGYERDGGKVEIKDMDEVVSEYYLRFIVIDKPGVLSKISGVLGKNDISISSVIQKGRKKEKDVPIVILTHEARERDLKNALREIDTLDVVLDKTKFIRIENNL